LLWHGCPSRGALGVKSRAFNTLAIKRFPFRVLTGYGLGNRDNPKMSLPFFRPAPGIRSLTAVPSQGIALAMLKRLLQNTPPFRAAFRTLLWSFVSNIHSPSSTTLPSPPIPATLTH
jgi:hypothetical protein